MPARNVFRPRRGDSRGAPQTPGPAGPPQAALSAPNHVWTADFKGQFKTLDGRYCYPLTVVDGYSRFLLGCQALDAPQGQLSRPVFHRLFRTYGLPRIIRTDNGAPFASSQALGRPRNDPHEALGQRPPVEFYQPSPRPFPRKLPPLHYPAHWEVRLVSTNGGIRWKTHRVAVSNALRQQPIGLEPIDDGVWEVWFGPLRLGRMDERQLTITDALGKAARRKLYTMLPDYSVKDVPDRSDRQGDAVTAGVYVTRLRYPGGVQTRRLLYLK